MSMSKREQVRPLAMPSPPLPTGTDEESSTAATTSASSRCLTRHRCLIYSFGCCGLATVLLGLAILIVALTAFKVKDPVLTINSVHLSAVSLEAFPTLSTPLSVNATLTADISVKNPNAASFRFARFKTEFYHNGTTVGVAHAQEGEARARRTLRMNVTVDLMADRVVGSGGLAEQLAAGSGEGTAELRSYTEVSGRVSVMGVYRKHLDIKLNCTLELRLSLGEQDLEKKDCQASI